MATCMEITRIVISETERRSYRHIWLEEIKPRVRHVAKPMPDTVIESTAVEIPAEKPPEAQIAETEPAENIAIVARDGRGDDLSGAGEGRKGEEIRKL
jgi:hypothetical protein